MRACVGTKFVSRWGDLMVDLALDAVKRITVTNPNTGKKEIDIKRYARVEKLPGGEMSDCRVLNGVMLNKDVTHMKMKRKRENPRILLMDCTLEYKKGESQTNIEIVNEDDWDLLLRQEEEYIERICGEIIAAKPDIVCTEKGISDLAQHYLVKHVDLDGSQQRQQTEDCLHRNEVPRDIDEQTSPPMRRPIVNFDRWHQSSSTLRRNRELRERGESTNQTNRAGGRDPDRLRGVGGDHQSVGLRHQRRQCSRLGRFAAQDYGLRGHGRTLSLFANGRAQFPCRPAPKLVGEALRGGGGHGACARRPCIKHQHARAAQLPGVLCIDPDRGGQGH